jgi:hypothetical protein
MFGGFAAHRRLFDVQSTSVAEERVGEKLSDFPNGHAPLPGTLIHLVFALIPVVGEMTDIRDVHHMIHLINETFQGASENIPMGVGPKIADMSVVVYCRAAAVQTDFPFLQWCKLLHLPSVGIYNRRGFNSALRLRRVAAQNKMFFVHKKLPESSDIFNIQGQMLTSEPMWRHTTFRVGGPADYFAVPEGEEDLRRLLTFSRSADVPVFVLGGGSNLLVADGGIRGIVIDMHRFDEYRLEGDLLMSGAGLEISDAAWKSGTQGYAGLDYFYGMPGSVGGAVWMNARCYGGEIADVLSWVDVMNFDGEVERIPMKKEGLGL